MADRAQKGASGKPTGGFVHLHVHSQYSLLDGACRTKDLPERAKTLGMDSIAVTDHGCLFGVIDFYQRCVDAGVKPILGMEAYMAPGDRRDRTYSGQNSGVKDGGYHLLLLAADLDGYRNLLKLASTAYLDGFYYKPRIDKAILKAHSAGLVATSACLGGEIPTALTASDKASAKRIAEHYIDCFGADRFFIELQSHIPEQAAVNPELVALADRLGVGLVATNDVHFLERDDHAPHDALCCISTGKLISETSRLKYPTELYLKSAQEMRAAAPDLARWEEACDNTLRIAAMCNVELDFKASHAPVVKVSRAAAGVQEELIPAETGSTQWLKQKSARYELLPFDSHKDGDSPAQLKAQCNAALRELAEAGAVWRYGEKGITPEIRARLDRELSVLSDKGISAYFLIVWDIVHHARSKGIPATARGSGVGTMVGYCLGLSNACPVKYGLLFERFTDPDRSEYPDIDIDICQDGRAAVLDYVRKKYGHVAQIITFGTLKAKAVLRDVGRVMDIPLADVDRIAKLIPETLHVTLEEALRVEPELRKEYNDNPRTRTLIDTGRRLEGLSRHASVHAAGVVIATQPLDSIVPLYRDPKAKENADGVQEIITQWDGPTCEKMGLLKMDFLGLRTLSIIERAKQLIGDSLDSETQRKTILGGFGAGPCPDSPREFGFSNLKVQISDLKSVDPLDLERLTYVDQNVLDLFRRGETAGIFQFESGGMRSLLMGMKPDRLEDLIAANALFRPGPMDLIGDYNDRKNRRSPVPRSHPVVERLTAETYGVMVYQEQVMQILHELGNVPLREAYTIIKAISKKKAKTIDAARAQFIRGAGEKNLSERDATELFDLILKFAGYGFNKSHSTGYAIIAYQTAYLKTYFPVQYMAALLTYESVSTEKVTEYIEQCRKVLFPDGHSGIDVLPPDINSSRADFTVVFEGSSTPPPSGGGQGGGKTQETGSAHSGAKTLPPPLPKREGSEPEPHDPNHGHIRFGLGAVKGVGGKAVETILEARRKDGAFRDFYDFCERVQSTLVNKGVVEALIKCGAFDALHGREKRAAMCAALEHAMSRGAQESSLRNSDDFLFGAVEADRAPETKTVAELPAVPGWDNTEALANEKAVLGFYVSSHPLDRYAAALDRFATATLREARGLREGAEVTIGVMVARVRPTFVKKGKSAGQKMAMLTLEDATGTMDAVLFSDAYARYAHLLEGDRVLFAVGKIDRRREEPSLVLDTLIPAEEAAEQLTRAVRITLRDMNPDGTPRKFNGELAQLKNMLRQTPGRAKVVFELHAGGKIVTVEPVGVSVKPSEKLPELIGGVLHGAGTCELVGPPRIVQQQHGTLPAESEPRRAQIVTRPPLDAAEPAEFCESIDRY